jgi:prepilin signal peptidase PulO-like enzyme (type II secretory pathway)
MSAHGYLTWLMPLAAALLFLTLAQFAAWMRRAEGGDADELPSVRGLWVGASVSLLTVFGVQETLEVTAAHGQFPTLTELGAALGWQVLPLVVAVGGVLALLLRGAAHVAAWAVRRHRHRARPLAQLVLVPRPPVVVSPACVLARFLAGRAPPSLV